MLFQSCKIKLLKVLLVLSVIDLLILLEMSMLVVLRTFLEV